ncbi:MAG: peptidase [Oceanicaulis sp.]|uniref:M13 family metallopeptidase n=1 Tax=Oceanicaulis sp. UBA2681 TaxID=1947007 RepID=UPI000C0AF7E3|nr:M13 family metallopeptidase [Oceanicaulis sp. UBA2681]MAP48097.1 peptidase [Oceanicaulis sp.]VXC98601.1 Peptidase [Oceanicaulis sp. 350]|tara:strand:- start:3201 stop:5282 length:2082 start_codon:yes stop_codon:yes gene_type:complete
MKQMLLSCSALAVLSLAACGPADAPADSNSGAQVAATETAAAPVYGTFGFDVDGMDSSVHAGDDFNQFANGTWLTETEIPGEFSRYGTFSILALEAEEQVQAIIDDAAAEGGEAGSNSQLVGDLYASWMNADAIEAAGVAPLQPYLAEIDAVETLDDAAALFNSIHHQSPYGFAVWADPSDPTVNALRLFQGGLGLGNRDYYLEDTERFQQYRDGYRNYIIRLHELAGLENGEANADAILALETRIAEAHWTREDSRDVTQTYNVMTMDELDALAPSFNFVEGAQALGLDVENLIVVQPTAIEQTSAIFAETDIDTIKAWMTFHFISDRASWLPAEFDQASFEFFGQTLRGQTEQRPRDRRGVNLVGGALGHAVGQIYVQRHFPPSSKTQMEDLVNRLTTAFRGRLEQLEWMDDETREQALTKLSTFEPRIGYPEIWDTYEGLEISADDYFGNRVSMAERGWAEQLEDLANPVDPREWGWPPQIVNASYNPLQNQITFPAGILQAPFFDPNADPALNFGGIGGVIGHEIGHGFDDNGRRYDSEGRLRDWWTEETNSRFEERSSVLAEQYDGFCPIDDMCVSGRLSMGENIGDLGGLQMAYTAWRDYVDEVYGGEAPVIDGLTGDQRFFLGWAQVWRNLYTDDALRAQLVQGPHSPPQYRINGVVRNLDAWYEAFGVTEEHELYLPPEQRVRIW